jgi:flagellar basal-body rod protein FlgG
LAIVGQNGLLQLDPSNSALITVGPAGEISQGGESKGQLKLTEFANAGALETAGTGLFVANDPAAQPRTATDSGVKQGFLENANTSSVSEMANLIGAMRYYEANHKMIQTEDDRVNHLISEIANPA